MCVTILMGLFSNVPHCSTEVLCTAVHCLPPIKCAQMMLQITTVASMQYMVGYNCVFSKHVQGTDHRVCGTHADDIEEMQLKLASVLIPTEPD